jgi:hypothetical protein
MGFVSEKKKNEKKQPATGIPVAFVRLLPRNKDKVTKG